jgi:hypothetical protein
MEYVNEETTSYLTVTFYDKNGDPAAPTSATWEAIDLKSGAVLQAETALSPASSIEITIPSSVNEIQDNTKEEEIRRITVIGVYGADDKVTQQYDYRVINLSRVS